MKLARLLCVAQALAVFGCAAGTRPPDDARPTRPPLHVHAPDLAQPLFESFPAADGYPNDSYPRPTIAYVPEGTSLLRVSETDTQDKIRLWANKEFSFSFAPDRPGLYTFVFYTTVRASEPARAGASATIWVE